MVNKLKYHSLNAKMKGMQANHLNPEELDELLRLMKDEIGAEYTREDHRKISDQLFYSYSRVQDVRALAKVLGESDLSEIDKKYLEF